MSIDYARCVRAYLKIRFARTALRQEYEAKDAELQSQQSVIEQAMLQAMQEAGIESTRTEYGTAYLATETHASVADWQAFVDWMLANQATAFLTKRVRKEAVEEYIETHGSPPPGVSLTRERVVRVRKA